MALCLIKIVRLEFSVMASKLFLLSRMSLPISSAILLKWDNITHLNIQLFMIVLPHIRLYRLHQIRIVHLFTPFAISLCKLWIRSIVDHRCF